jgi:hypothetical protein
LSHRKESSLQSYDDYVFALKGRKIEEKKRKPRSEKEQERTRNNKERTRKNKKNEE